MKKYIIIILLTFFTTYGFAQLEISKSKFYKQVMVEVPDEKMVGLSLTMNYHRTFISEINDFFDTNNLIHPEINYFNFGGGLNFKYINHLIHLGADVDVSEKITFNTANIGTKSFGLTPRMNYGYIVYDNYPFSIMPFIGISRTSFKVDIKDKPTSSNGLNNLSTYRNAVRLENNVLNVEIGSRFLLESWEYGNLGIEFNYSFPLTHSWSIDGHTIETFRKSNPGGLKVGIILMFMSGSY